MSTQSDIVNNPRKMCGFSNSVQSDLHKMHSLHTLLLLFLIATCVQGQTLYQATNTPQTSLAFIYLNTGAGITAVRNLLNDTQSGFIGAKETFFCPYVYLRSHKMIFSDDTAWGLTNTSSRTAWLSYHIVFPGTCEFFFLIVAQGQ